MTKANVILLSGGLAALLTGIVQAGGADPGPCCAGDGGWNSVSLASSKAAARAKAEAEAGVKLRVNVIQAPPAVIRRRSERVTAGIRPVESSTQLAGADYYRWHSSYRETVTTKAYPTPVPTATPRPTPQPTPVPTVTPQPTPVPTVTPQPTPVPTATPRPTPTPRPTATPQPTPFPTATPRPTPVPTVTPMPTPRPTDTPPDDDEHGKPGSAGTGTGGWNGQEDAWHKISSKVGEIGALILHKFDEIIA